MFIVQTHEQGMWDISYVFYDAFNNVLHPYNLMNQVIAQLNKSL